MPNFGEMPLSPVERGLKLAERAVYRMEEAVLKEPKANTDTPSLTVETIDNHIYFYADVNADRCLAMIRSIREVDSRLRNERTSRGVGHATPIWLHIFSNGGDLFAGLAVADQLQAIQSPIYSVVEGVCASAATLISLACTQRLITPSSFMLVHQFTQIKWGTYEQFVDEMNLQDMLMERLVAFYADRTKMPKRKVRSILKRDTWFSAEQCLELGLADQIYCP